MSRTSVGFLSFHSIFLLHLNLGGWLPAQKPNSQVGVSNASHTTMLAGRLLSLQLFFSVSDQLLATGGGHCSMQSGVILWRGPSKLPPWPLLAPDFMPRGSGKNNCEFHMTVPRYCHLSCRGNDEATLCKFPH